MNEGICESVLVDYQISDCYCLIEFSESKKKNVLKSSVVSLKFVMDSFSREIGGTSKIFYHSIKRF